MSYEKNDAFAQRIQSISERVSLLDKPSIKHQKNTISQFLNCTDLTIKQQPFNILKNRIHAIQDSIAQEQIKLSRKQQQLQLIIKKRKQQINEIMNDKKRQNYKATLENTNKLQILKLQHDQFLRQEKQKKQNIIKRLSRQLEDKLKNLNSNIILFKNDINLIQRSVKDKLSLQFKNCQHQINKNLQKYQTFEKEIINEVKLSQKALRQQIQIHQRQFDRKEEIIRQITKKLIQIDI